MIKTLQIIKRIENKSNQNDAHSQTLERLKGFSRSSWRWLYAKWPCLSIVLGFRTLGKGDWVCCTWGHEMLPTLLFLCSSQGLFFSCFVFLFLFPLLSFLFFFLFSLFFFVFIDKDTMLISASYFFTLPPPEVCLHVSCFGSSITFFFFL